MDLIFSDLDGTLLDHETYEWTAARPALEELERRRVPWVLVTSKTRAEVEALRVELGHHHPFIVENGGAAFVPEGYFPFEPPGSRRADGYAVLEWGSPYLSLVADLRQAAQRSGCRVRGFADLTLEETAALSALPAEKAALARRREYDEPFLVLDTDRAGALRAALEEQGRSVTEGGRFWHVMGDNDKGRAVRSVTELFERVYGAVRTIGLGDGLNDAAFLNVVQLPVIIRTARAEQMQRAVPRALVTRLGGPAGWNEAVLELAGG